MRLVLSGVVRALGGRAKGNEEKKQRQRLQARRNTHTTQQHNNTNDTTHDTRHTRAAAKANETRQNQKATSKKQSVRAQIEAGRAVNAPPAKPGSATTQHLKHKHTHRRGVRPHAVHTRASAAAWWTGTAPQAQTAMPAHIRGAHAESSKKSSRTFGWMVRSCHPVRSLAEGPFISPPHGFLQAKRRVVGGERAAQHPAAQHPDDANGVRGGGGGGGMRAPVGEAKGAAAEFGEE